MRFISFILLLFLLFVADFSALAQRERRKKGGEPPSKAMRASETEAAFTEGEKYFILEDYSKALLYFLRAYEIDSENAAIAYKIAEVLMKSNKDEDLVRATSYIEQALRLEKKNKYYYLLASNIYNSQGLFSKSAVVLETMIKEVPQTEDYLYELASIYLFDKKEAEALRVYNRAESSLGINEISSLQKQRIFLDQGKLDEAIKEGEKLIEAFPEEERYVLALAETLSQNKQTARAIIYIEKYLKENPSSSAGKMLLGGLYRDSGNEEKSRSLVRELFNDPKATLNSKLIMLGTYNATLAQARATGKADTNLETFVVELYAKLEETNPSDANVQLAGGDLFMSLEKQREAKERYLKSIRLGTTSFEAWQNLLYLETQEKQYDSVIMHAEEALEIFPNQSNVYYFNGYAHLRKRDYRNATQLLEQAKRLSKSNEQQVAEINSMLGDAYQAMKEYEKSSRAYDEALEFNPMNDIVLNNYSYYLSLRKADLEKAEKMSSLLVKNHPDNISYLDTYAWVLYNREKYKEAKKVMERALSLDNPSAINFEHYGDILFQLGDVDEAVEQWRKAKAMGSLNQEIDKKIANRKIL